LDSIILARALIGLICNTGRTPGFGLRRFLDRAGIAKCFDIMLFSDEIGIRKPNPEIFLKAAETMSVKPCEIVHVGDNLKSDVYGAKNAGFKAIHVSTETGRGKIAESDPNSLVSSDPNSRVSISRKVGDLEEEEIIPDRTVTSLGMVVEAIRSLDYCIGHLRNFLHR
jgi:FMN phosphatase YigB (HAD superfamily)